MSPRPRIALASVFFWALLLVAVLALTAHGAESGGGKPVAPLREGAGARGASVLPRYRVAYATYLGGSNWDQAREIIVYPDGSVLVGAQSASKGMPVTEGVVQREYGGDDPELGHGGVYGGDCYLVRLDAAGSRVLAGTYFGGSRQERNVYGMELDAAGNIVIATMTRSPDAPTTEGAFQPRYAGGASDMLVAKLSPDLRRILWSTYVGGSADDSPRGGLALDGEGNVCVVGTSNSRDFPTTAGALQTELRGPRDSTIVKLSADGSDLVLGTFLGGTGADDAIMGVRFGAGGAMYVAGHTKSADFPVTQGAAQPKLGGLSDAYAALVAPEGDKLLYATYLGGRLNEFAEHRPWLEPGGTLLVSGFSASPDFPTTDWAYQQEQRGASDGFLTRISPDGQRFTLCMLLGGSGTEFWLMPVVDAWGRIYLGGSTSSKDFPVTADALQREHQGGEDAVLAVLSPDGSQLLYATFLGGEGDEMVRSLHVTADGDVFLVGSTSSKDFPISSGALQQSHGGRGDAFVAKLEATPRFVPGRWVSLFDGKTLSGWRPFEDRVYPNSYGKVNVEDGKLILSAGPPMTGITWSRHVPKENYEIRLEGTRVSGEDFFCGLTFPVADEALTLILGGWGGSVVGLSNVDGGSAVENETTTSIDFEGGRWYRVRVRVTPEKIQVWLDDESIVEQDRAGHRFDIWPQQDPGKPLGITSYATNGAFRKIEMRSLAP